jgi:hypothetical protein
MDAKNPGTLSGISQKNATSQRAKKRRRCSSPQGETLGESSRSKRKRTASSRPTSPQSSLLLPLLPPSQPGGGTAYSTLGPISTVQYPYPSTIHQQPSIPPPSVVWPPVPTPPATMHIGTHTCTKQTTGPSKGPAIPPSVNYHRASVGFELQPKGSPLPGNTSPGSQQSPDSGATNGKPCLGDLLDPPANQRPSQTIRVLASAALRSERKGKLTLGEIVDRICSRFQYFQDLQNRAKLKVGLASPRCDAMLIKMIDKY